MSSHRSFPRSLFEPTENNDEPDNVLYKLASDDETGYSTVDPEYTNGFNSRVNDTATESVSQEEDALGPLYKLATPVSDEGETEVEGVKGESR